MAATEKALRASAQALARAVREAVDIEDAPELGSALDMFDLADNLYGIFRA